MGTQPPSSDLQDVYDTVFVLGSFSPRSHYIIKQHSSRGRKASREPTLEEMAKTEQRGSEMSESCGLCFKRNDGRALAHYLCPRSRVSGKQRGQAVDKCNLKILLNIWDYGRVPEDSLDAGLVAE